MRMRVVLDVDVDKAAWAAEYDLAPTEVVADAHLSILGMLGEVADAKAAQMGTFTIRTASAQVMRR
jgi:hypothetical protein